MLGFLPHIGGEFEYFGLYEPWQFRPSGAQPHTTQAARILES